MKNIGVKFKLFICLTLVVTCAFFASLNLSMATLHVEATTTVITNATSYDEFSAALDKMKQQAEATQDSLVILELNQDVFVDDSGEYVVTEQVCRQFNFNAQETNYLKDLAEATGYQISVDGSSVILTRPYGNKRLLIYSEAPELEPYGALATINYRKLHIHQYGSETAARTAYYYYKENTLVRCVTTDGFCWTQSTNDLIASAETALSYQTWGASVMGVPGYSQYLLDTVTANNNIDKLPTVTVAVLDTGIRTDHPWFQDRLWVEDGKYVGVDYTKVNQGKTEYLFEDDDGHGTHCSGIICDMTLSNVKILPIKFMCHKDGKATGDMSNAIDAIEYVLDNREKYNITVMNMSFGVGPSPENNYSNSQFADDSNIFSLCIENAYNEGVFSVIAAGNESCDANNITPANAAAGITVSALKKENSRVVFDDRYSNHGSVIDVCAPGTNITSAYHNKMLEIESGTSMAAPHVAAYIALLQSDQLHVYSQDEINRILNGEVAGYLTDLDNNGRDDLYGNGLPVLTAATPNYVMVNITMKNNMGRISPSGYQMCTHGSDLTITIQPNPDAYVFKIYVDGNLVPDSKGLLEYTLTNITAEHTVEIEFESNSYTVSHYFEKIYDMESNAPHEYEVQTEVLHGDVGTITNAVAQDVPGFTAQPFENDIIVATGNTEIKIYYLRNKYQLNVRKAETDQGIISIDGSTSGTYLYGAAIEITPKFRSGYGLDQWAMICHDANFAASFNNLNANQKFTMPASDLNLVANSERGLYTITVNVSGSGTVYPGKSTILRSGDTMILDLTAEDGYTVKAVTCNGQNLEVVQNGVNDYSVKLFAIDADTELSVEFAKVADTSHGPQWERIILNGGWIFAGALYLGSLVLLVLAFNMRRR